MADCHMMVLRLTALTNSCWGTRSGTIACLEGVSNAPAKDVIKMVIYISMGEARPLYVAIVKMSVARVMTIWAVSIIFFLSKTSATIPPKSEKETIGINLERPIRLRENAEPVRR